jgi:hypothetical protein
MGEKIVKFLKHPLVLIGIGFFLIVVLGASAYGFKQTQTPPEQPIQFPHRVHVGLDIPCLYCHPGALRGTSPGLPTEAKCWACHGQLAKYADGSVPLPTELQKLKGYVDRGEPIPWVPVAQVPDFVHFRHRPHVAAGLNCENCHGELGGMTVYENPQTMNMGWCLKCHRSRAEAGTELYIKLTDCGTCHY